MKANEAPKKIYLQEPTKVRTKKKYDNDVEYIRTDAFIKKAITWLKENITNDYTASKVISRKGCVTMGMLIEDFIKAIKI